MNQHLLLDVILAVWQCAFCYFEKKRRVAVLFQNNIFFFVVLFWRRCICRAIRGQVSKYTQRVFTFGRWLLQIRSCIFIRIAIYEKCEKENLQWSIWARKHAGIAASAGYFIALRGCLQTPLCSLIEPRAGLQTQPASLRFCIFR